MSNAAPSMSLWSRSSPSAAVLYPERNLEHFLLPNRLKSEGLKVKKDASHCFILSFCSEGTLRPSSHSWEVLTHFPCLCVKNSEKLVRAFNSYITIISLTVAFRKVLIWKVSWGPGVGSGLWTNFPQRRQGHQFWQWICWHNCSYSSASPWLMHKPRDHIWGHGRTQGPRVWDDL